MSKESSGYLISPTEIIAYALIQESQKGGINKEMATKIIPQLRGELRKTLTEIVQKNSNFPKSNS